MAHQKHDHNHNFLQQSKEIATNERKTALVVVLTAITMVVEITAGYLTQSMALLGDGWHMASHAGALGISYLAYRAAKSKTISQYLSFGPGKIIPLGGYTSAIILAIIAILMSYHSAVRIFNPATIQFNEAIFVAVLGLIVNIACAVVLFDKHHHHEHHGHNHVHDHNLKSAYIHVIADAMTSIFAIIALVVGKYYGAIWLDR